MNGTNAFAPPHGVDVIYWSHEPPMTDAVQLQILKGGFDDLI